MPINLPLANLDAVGAKVIEHEEGFTVITATTR